MLTRAQRDWALDNIGSPAAPLSWFAGIQAGAAALRWLLALAKWLVLVLWAVLFIWLWFFVFTILFLWEGFSSSKPPPSDSPPLQSGS